MDDTIPEEHEGHRQTNKRAGGDKAKAGEEARPAVSPRSGP
jgi:hypothetical protein